MSLPKEKAWWPRKTVGYGWTWPTTWQGWAVTIAYCIVSLTAGLLFLPTHPGRFIGTLLSGTALLLVVSYWKGEAPHRDEAK